VYRFEFVWDDAAAGVECRFMVGACNECTPIFRSCSLGHVPLQATFRLQAQMSR
jgi:hypothetical protein